LVGRDAPLNAMVVLTMSPAAVLPTRLLLQFLLALTSPVALHRLVLATTVATASTAAAKERMTSLFTYSNGAYHDE